MDMEKGEIYEEGEKEAGVKKGRGKGVKRRMCGQLGR